MISHPALFFLNFRERVHDLYLPHRVRSEQDVNDNAQTIRRSRWWNYRNNNDFRNHIGFGGIVIFFAQRYKRCPPDQVMVIYGRTAKANGWKG